MGRAITVDIRNEAMKLLTESDLRRQRDGTRESHTLARARDREGATVGCCYRSSSTKAHVAVFSVCKPQRVQATDRRLDKIPIRSAAGLSCEGSPLTASRQPERDNARSSRAARRVQ